MSAFNAVAVTLSLALAGLTAARIWSSSRALRASGRATDLLREFAGALSLELGAGSGAAEAAEHVLGGLRGPGTRDLLREVGTGVRRVALGARAREVADSCGEELRPLFALWAVAEEHGIALGRLMERHGEDLAAQRTGIDRMRSALAGARMTETVLLLLPAGAVALGQATGLGSAAFLAGNVLGNALLVAGTLLACGGVLWAESLTVTVLGGVGARAGPAELAAARGLDVFAEALAAGLTVPAAWTVSRTVAGGGGEPGPGDLVGHLIGLGAGPGAWSPLAADPLLGPVARQAARQTRSGARLAETSRVQAARLRRAADDRARAGGERVLVAVAAPLTLCFLPSFVLVGLAPLVAGLAGA